MGRVVTLQLLISLRVELLLVLIFLLFFLSPLQLLPFLLNLIPEFFLVSDELFATKLDTLLPLDLILNNLFKTLAFSSLAFLAGGGTAQVYRGVVVKEVGERFDGLFGQACCFFSLIERKLQIIKLTLFCP